jgi:dolichol-phosphate mannosyltransferase
MKSYPAWCVVVPMANEESDFASFVAAMTKSLDQLNGGHVFLVVDEVSKDATRQFCEGLGKRDARFTLVWSPQNRNVVDAYLNGFRAALRAGFEWIVEMDAGLSHDPAALTVFLNALADGNECVFGSRFVPGGSMRGSPFSRIFLSLAGSWAAQVFLGSRMRDVTSGYEAFRREVVEKLTAYPLRSRAHFYQTEVRHLLRKRRWIEVPIVYQAPSPRVCRGALRNALEVLGYYFFRRLTGASPSL